MAECAARLQAAGVDLEGYAIPEVVEDMEAARLALNDEGFAPPPHPALHQLIVIAHREEDHRATAMGAHIGDQLVVGIEDGRTVARDRLHDDPLDRRQLA